jgi:hypothetical protein
MASPLFQAFATANVENPQNEEQRRCREKNDVQHDFSSLLTLEMPIESQDHAQNKEILCGRDANYAGRNLGTA